jgi:membrane peptidoglycan carboxypeptidase
VTIGPRRLAVILALVAGIAFVFVAWPRWIAIRDRADALADAHLAHDVAHPGWSFPARVWSAPAPLDLARPRLVAEAHARAYADACPPARPGEVCPDTGAVIPRNGNALEPVLIGRLVGPDAELREHLPIDDAPKALLAAITAAEDEDFWSHHGVHVRGLLRAAIADARGAPMQGASTLTMQLVRDLSQDDERTFARKAREALAAIAVDAHLGKRGVMGAYLDAPYLGQSGSQSVCGFQAAARYYWGVDAHALTLAQSATLAAILPAPGEWAPDANAAGATARRNRLLRRMAELGWDATEVERATNEPMGAAPHADPPPRWPTYLQATRAWLEDNLDPTTLYGSGLDVLTAFDPVVQEIGDRVLPDRVAYLERNVGRNGPEPLEAAAVVLDTRTGLLVAVHDPRAETATDFNRATQIRRQSGSALKPLVYGLALAQLGPDGHPAMSAATTMPNEPRTFANTNGWRPLNVGDDYSPTSTLAMGLAWSENIVAASLLEASGGPKALIDLAGRVGFDTRAWPVEMGLALGQAEVSPLEMARLSAMVARGGIAASARPVVTAIDAGGRVRIAAPADDARVLPEESALILRDLMRLVITYGTAYTVKGVDGIPGYTAAAIGKTGTSDEEKDDWFIGATPLYATAVWLGYETPARIGGTAGDLSGPLWGWWMRALHEGLDAGDFAGPVLDHKAICTQSGKLGNGTCRLITAPFLPGTAPKTACAIEHPPREKNAYENVWQRKARLRDEALQTGRP